MRIVFSEKEYIKTHMESFESVDDECPFVFNYYTRQTMELLNKEYNVARPKTMIQTLFEHTSGPVIKELTTPQFSINGHSLEGFIEEAEPDGMSSIVRPAEITHTIDEEGNLIIEFE